MLHHSLFEVPSHCWYGSYYDNVRADLGKEVIINNLPTQENLISFSVLKVIYPKKAAKFCEIFTLLLSYVVPVKSKVKIFQNFVAFSEYMNFTQVNEIIAVKKSVNLIFFYVFRYHKIYIF